MNISIIIPTYNNLEYLKICLESLKKNSQLKHEIILHVNDGSDGTLKFAKENNILHSFSVNNVGLCTAINTAVKKASSNLLLYAHDDMYFCPNWDNYLLYEINQIDHNLYYFSGTMIEKNSAHISFNCGETFENFDENKLLNNFDKLVFFNHQGSHFAPHLVHRELWDKVGGFSEEFSPGLGSDPDFNMKLWNIGVRLFKGLGKCRVYHFSSISLRKKAWNNGSKIFLLKWGISIKFFKRYYLRTDEPFKGELKKPYKSFIFFFDLIKCKLHLMLYKIKDIFYSKIKKKII